MSGALATLSERVRFTSEYRFLFVVCIIVVYIDDSNASFTWLAFVRFTQFQLQHSCNSNRTKKCNVFMKNASVLNLQTTAKDKCNSIIDEEEYVRNSAMQQTCVCKGYFNNSHARRYWSLARNFVLQNLYAIHLVWYKGKKTAVYCTHTHTHTHRNKWMVDDKSHWFFSEYFCVPAFRIYIRTQTQKHTEIPKHGVGTFVNIVVLTWFTTTIGMALPTWHKQRLCQTQIFSGMSESFDCRIKWTAEWPNWISSI